VIRWENEKKVDFIFKVLFQKIFIFKLNKFSYFSLNFFKFENKFKENKIENCASLTGFTPKRHLKGKKTSRSLVYFLINFCELIKELEDFLKISKSNRNHHINNAFSTNHHTQQWTKNASSWIRDLFGE
jgi:hypothetical protein